MAGPIDTCKICSKVKELQDSHLLPASVYKKLRRVHLSDLNNGAEVRVAGIHEGTVRRIDLPKHPNEKVRVVMDLQKGTHEVIKQDSVAAIRSEGLVGDKYVEISFGSEQAAKGKGDDIIQIEPPLQMSDLVKKADDILNSAQGAMESVNAAASNLRSISGKINQGRGTMGALVNDREVYQHASAAANALQEDMEALKHNFLLRGYFNKRGYEDSTDLKKHEVSQSPAETPVKEFTYEGNKIFDKADTAKLKKPKDLNEAGSYLENNPFGVAVVAAREDLKGDSEKNQVLAEARAMVVRDYQVENLKLDDLRIKTIAFAKSPDVGANGRVEILVYPPRAKTPETSRP